MCLRLYPFQPRKYYRTKGFSVTTAILCLIFYVSQLRLWFLDQARRQHARDKPSGSRDKIRQRYVLSPCSHTHTHAHTHHRLSVPIVKATSVATKLVKILNSIYELSSVLGNKITVDGSDRSERG